MNLQSINNDLKSIDKAIKIIQSLDGLYFNRLASINEMLDLRESISNKYESQKLFIESIKKESKKLEFPQDFIKSEHRSIKGAFQWLPINKQYIFISIVGGGYGLYGDGINTFEIMIGHDVERFLDTNEINKKLSSI